MTGQISIPQFTSALLVADFSVMGSDLETQPLDSRQRIQTSVRLQRSGEDVSEIYCAFKVSLWNLGKYLVSILIRPC